MKSIGFDATCSLVAVGKEGQALSVSPSNKPEQDIIVDDHRAVQETVTINLTNDPFCGMSGRSEH